MSDPRLNGRHLDVARHDQYDATVDEMLDARGPATVPADPGVRPSVALRAPTRPQAPPPGGTYTLVSLADGRRHPLRVGINTVGRYSSNDIVLTPIFVSRRHCIVLVHATGSCEVFDTASRNGTWVNHNRVGRADLLPGDVLMVTDQRFLVAWVGPGVEVFPSREASDTLCSGNSTPTG
jgi:pSer/pThr/pTyr-binding forkhead associated (FHA) protein